MFMNDNESKIGEDMLPKETNNNEISQEKEDIFYMPKVLDAWIPKPCGIAHQVGVV